MEKNVKQIGVLDTKGYESDQRVYSRGGCCITLKAGNLRAKVIRRYESKIARSGREKSQKEP